MAVGEIRGLVEEAFPEVCRPEFEQGVVLLCLCLEIEGWVEEANDLVDGEGLHGGEVFLQCPRAGCADEASDFGVDAVGKDGLVPAVACEIEGGKGDAVLIRGRLTVFVEILMEEVRGT